jgi:hypothetical protein
MNRRARRAHPTSILLAAPAGLLGLVVMLAACSAQVIGTGGGQTRQGDCPQDSPYAGEPCGAPAICVYQGEGCGHSFSCDGTSWQEAGDACPVPEAGACPSSIPTPGAPCVLDAKACVFDVPGDCPGEFVATCGGNGVWALFDQSQPCMDHPCPTTEPTAGDACDYPYSCTYTVVPAGCSPETQNASCVNGTWTVDVPACIPE